MKAFGELKTAAAIPYLIENISLDTVTIPPDTFSITLDSARQRLPAAEALIRIGAPSITAIFLAWPRMSFRDRMAAILVMSFLGRRPELSGRRDIREFLSNAQAEAGMQLGWAREALTDNSSHASGGSARRPLM